jgi:oligoribonuclease NrnB/cAMP/cGMP phosphodiesterase (DHH superfamily)
MMAAVSITLADTYGANAHMVLQGVEGGRHWAASGGEDGRQMCQSPTHKTPAMLHSGTQNLSRLVFQLQDYKG